MDPLAQDLVQCIFEETNKISKDFCYDILNINHTLIALQNLVRDYNLMRNIRSSKNSFLSQFILLFLSVIVYVEYKIYQKRMNSINLLPHPKKDQPNQLLPNIRSLINSNHMGSPDLCKLLNINPNFTSKNPLQNMNPPDLSLAQNKGDIKKLKHEHLNYVEQKQKPQKLEIGQNIFLKAFQGFTQVETQNKDPQKPIQNEAEEEFSKKFKRMYQFPASVSEALIHRRAYRNGFNSSSTVVVENNKQREDYTQLCPCCQNFVNTIEIPLFQSTYPKKQYKTSEQRKIFLKRVTDSKHQSENAFLFKGGDALFFCFIKLIITFLLIRFFLLDAFNLYTNYMGTYCDTYRNKMGQKDLCINWLVSVFSTYNNATAEGQAYLEFLDIISLVVTFISILFCLYGRVKLYELYWFLEKGDITEDDYTILIEDIPPIPYIGNDTLIKDVNQEYRDFIKKLVSDKIRIWLNSFYSYDNQNEIQNKLDKDFYKVFQQKKKAQLEAELFQNIVSNISLCYDLTELENLQNMRQNLVQHFLEEQGNKQAMENSLFDQQNDERNEIERQYIAHLPHQIEIINQHYVRLCQKISDAIVLKNDEPHQLKVKHKQTLSKQVKKPVDQLQISRFVGKAFVSFQYQHYKHYLLQKIDEDKDYLKVNGNTVRLTLSHAQKPNDIYWKNMKVSNEFRKIQIRNSYLLVLVGLLVSTSIMYILRSVQSSIVNFKVDKKSTFDSIILYSIPLWTFLVNYFLDWGIFQLTQSEKHKTKTEELTSLIIKNTAAKFINTSVIYALIFIFGQRVNPLKQNGLVNTIFDLVYVNVALNIALQFLQPGWIYSNYKNKKYLKRDPNDKNAVQKVNVFQIKLNKMLEMPTFDFAQAYSYYLQMIYICSFYCFLIPAITPILIIAFGIQYWVDKRNLLKRCSSPIDMGYFLTKLIWTCFEMSLILYVLGHWIWGTYFYSQQKLKSKIFNYANFAIACGYSFIVTFFPQQIENFTTKYASQSGLSNQSYNQVCKKFEKTYRAQNPATSFLNQKEEDMSLAAPRILDQIRDKALQQILHVAPKQKLKSLLFVPPADSKQNIQKLKRIYNYPEMYTLKCDEDADQNFQDYKTFLCCL